MAERVISYAQNREDIILSAFFLNQPSGFYVDVGASDPNELSVTKYFYERGWNGVNVEPNPRLYKKLLTDRPRDININMGISNQRSMLTFREYEVGDGLSTFSEDTKKELANTRHPLAIDFKDYNVKVDRLDNVLDGVDNKLPTIDFIKIDVEGYEYEVVEGNDWTKYRPKVICIEANHIHKDWPAILKKNNYEKRFDDGLNHYYVDTKRKDIHFDYIDAMIGRDIVPAYLQKTLDKLDIDNRHLNDELSLLRNESIENEDEINRLTAYLLDHSRLRVLVKDLIKKIHKVILLRLSNQLKIDKRYPLMKLDDNVDDPKEILLKFIEADLIVFSRRPSITKKIKRAIAKTIYRLYLAVVNSISYLFNRFRRLSNILRSSE
jgi:FkbM family methyltransferase